MSCYCQGHELIRLCICCQRYLCSENQRKGSSQISQKQGAENVIEDIERNFAQIMERELKSLSDRKEQEISDLEAMVSKLKTDMLRLENRNKLDKENENRLKEEVKRLSNRIKDLEDALNRTYVKERKEVIVEEKKVVEPEKVTVHRIQNPQFDFLKDQVAKINSQKSLLEQTNKNLQDKLKRMSDAYEDKITQLNDKINELSQNLRRKDDVINGMQKQKTDLQQRLTIFSKPSRFQPEPIILHKVTNLPAEIRTVYVDRPIEKTKVVEVQKVIKKFIEPDRPIVNRIIQCPPSSKKCRCDSSDSQRQSKSNSNMDVMNERIENLQSEYNEVINGYKGEREKLVRAIENRDSEYRLLEKKVELIEKITAKPSKKCGHQDIVEVKVWKDGERQGSEPSEKRTKTETNVAIKNTFVRTDQKTKKK